MPSVIAGVVVLPTRDCTRCPFAGPFGDSCRSEENRNQCLSPPHPPPHHHPHHRCRLSGAGSRRSRGPSVLMLHNIVPCFPTNTPSAPQLMATWWCQGVGGRRERKTLRELALGSQQSPTHPLCPPHLCHPTSILPSGLVLITEGWRSTPPTHTSFRGWGPRGLGLGQ